MKEEHIHQAHSPDIIKAEFLDLGTNKEVTVDVKRTDTLRKAWDEAYKKLAEKQKPSDRLLCAEGDASLMGDLDLTFEQLHEKKICPHHKYKIRRETGGA
jgi:hypothetical protein